MQRQYHYRGFRVAIEAIPTNSQENSSDELELVETHASGYTAVVTLTKSLGSGTWNARFRLDDLCEAPVVQESTAFWLSYIAATKIIDDTLMVFGGSVDALPKRLTAENAGAGGYFH